MNITAQALLQALGPSMVLTGTEVSSRSNGYWDSSPVEALALVRPRETADMSSALRICNQDKQSVVVHGGLTGAVHGAKSLAEDIVISTENMSGIEELDPVGATITVQAGVCLQTIQEAASEAGFHFPLDLGARGSCTIGGNIATNAGGINVIRFGMLRQHVLGLEAVLADGTVISSMNAMMKNNAGYDLKQLFIGSEGTLGVVTRAVLKLSPGLISRNTALVALTSFTAVSTLLNTLQRELGGNLSAFEVMWGMYYQGMTAANPEKAPLSREYPFYVVIEAEGSNPETDKAIFLQTLENAFECGLLSDAVIAKSDSERQAIWEIREEIGVLLQKQPAFLYDVSLPIRHMEQYVNDACENVRTMWSDSEVDVFGHVGDGNLHFFVKPNVAGDEATLHELSDRAIYSPLETIGGSVSAEHGIGIDKRLWLSQTRSEAEIALMRQLKHVMDPNNILNKRCVL